MSFSWLTILISWQAQCLCILHMEVMVHYSLNEGYVMLDRGHCELCSEHLFFLNVCMTSQSHDVMLLHTERFSDHTVHGTCDCYESNLCAVCCFHLLFMLFSTSYTDTVYVQNGCIRSIYLFKQIAYPALLVFLVFFNQSAWIKCALSLHFYLICLTISRAD